MTSQWVAGVKVEFKKTKKVDARTTRFKDRHDNRSPAMALEMLVCIS
jgi:hypothetical protein